MVDRTVSGLLFLYLSCFLLYLPLFDSLSSSLISDLSRTHTPSCRYATRSSTKQINICTLPWIRSTLRRVSSATRSNIWIQYIWNHWVDNAFNSRYIDHFVTSHLRTSGCNFIVIPILTQVSTQSLSRLPNCVEF